MYKYYNGIGRWFSAGGLGVSPHRRNPAKPREVWEHTPLAGKFEISYIALGRISRNFRGAFKVANISLLARQFYSVDLSASLTQLHVVDMRNYCIQG